MMSGGARVNNNSPRGDKKSLELPLDLSLVSAGEARFEDTVPSC